MSTPERPAPEAPRPQGQDRAPGSGVATPRPEGPNAQAAAASPDASLPQGSPGRPFPDAAAVLAYVAAEQFGSGLATVDAVPSPAGSTTTTAEGSTSGAPTTGANAEGVAGTVTGGEAIVRRGAVPVEDSQAAGSQGTTEARPVQAATDTAGDTAGDTAVGEEGAGGGDGGDDGGTGTFDAAEPSAPGTLPDATTGDSSAADGGNGTDGAVQVFSPTDTGYYTTAESDAAAADAAADADAALGAAAPGAGDAAAGVDTTPDTAPDTTATDAPDAVPDSGTDQSTNVTTTSEGSGDGGATGNGSADTGSPDSADSADSAPSHEDSPEREAPSVPVLSGEDIGGIPVVAEDEDVEEPTTSGPLTTQDVIGGVASPRALIEEPVKTEEDVEEGPAAGAVEGRGLVAVSSEEPGEPGTDVRQNGEVEDETHEEQGEPGGMTATDPAAEEPEQDTPADQTAEKPEQDVPTAQEENPDTGAPTENPDDKADVAREDAKDDTGSASTEVVDTTEDTNTTNVGPAETDVDAAEGPTEPAQDTDTEDPKGAEPTSARRSEPRAQKEREYTTAGEGDSARERRDQAEYDAWLKSEAAKRVEQMGGTADPEVVAAQVRADVEAQQRHWSQQASVRAQHYMDYEGMSQSQAMAAAQRDIVRMARDVSGVGGIKDIRQVGTAMVMGQTADREGVARRASERSQQFNWGPMAGDVRDHRVQEALREAAREAQYAASDQSRGNRQERGEHDDVDPEYAYDNVEPDSAAEEHPVYDASDRQEQERGDSREEYRGGGYQEPGGDDE